MFGDSMFGIALFLIVGAIVILFASHLFSVKKDDDVIDDITDHESVEVEDDFPVDIVNVPGHHFLYYSLITCDVYKMSIEGDTEFLDIFTNNNHQCKYLGGRIMEVVGDEIIAIVHTAILPN